MGTAVERYLVDLAGRCVGAPLVDELTEADLKTPCGTASIARAALSVLRSKSPDQIAADLRRQLAEDDLLAAVRLRAMSGDLAEVDFVRSMEISQARAESGDVRYRKRVAP